MAEAAAQGGHDIVVIGASAGGVEVLAQLVSGLPAGLPASFFVVCHVPAQVPSRLPEILSRAGAVLATSASDGEPIYPGHMYVATPDRHLMLQDGQVRVTRGPRENLHRPAIDPLFRTAARWYGPRVIGVLLSGSLYDGVAGLLAIRNAGGIAVVQDPRDAQVAMLPQAATEIAGADYVVTAAELAGLLVQLVKRPVGGGNGPMSNPLEKMPRVVDADLSAQEQGNKRGGLSVFTCPECGGALWQVDEQELAQFRCHVGHVYLGEALLAEQSENLEAALWSAVRTFKEKAVLARQLAAQERQRGRGEVAQRFDEQADLAERYGVLIQEYLLNANGGTLQRDMQVQQGNAAHPDVPSA